MIYGLYIILYDYLCLYVCVKDESISNMEDPHFELFK